MEITMLLTGFCAGFIALLVLGILCIKSDGNKDRAKIIEYNERSLDALIHRNTIDRAILEQLQRIADHFDGK